MQLLWESWPYKEKLLEASEEKGQYTVIYVANVKQDQRKRLDPGGRECTLLGYGNETKGYRLYNHESCKVFYRRDVIFNELKELK